MDLGVSHRCRFEGCGLLTVQIALLKRFYEVHQIRRDSGIGALAPQYDPRQGHFGSLARRQGAPRQRRSRRAKRAPDTAFAIEGRGD